MPASETLTTFSSSSEDPITRSLDIKPDTTAAELSSSEFNTYYEIEETAEEIVRKDYKRIALQFPDELLHDSVRIHFRLKARIGAGRQLYVLADTSYGSCCVDEVAAQHVDADAMVHYGYACLSRTSRLPVIYVFGKKKVDAEHCAKQLVEALQSNFLSETTSSDGPVLLKHDVAYNHLAGEIVAKLKEALEALKIPLHYKTLATRTAPVSSDSDLNEDHESAIEYPYIFYIGGETLGLTNLLMTNHTSNVISYDPITSSICLESKTNKLLMRRYAIVQKARDADVFGILVGTLGVASYLPLIKYLRTLLVQHHKKAYTICVGKLNPAKLANFLEIECFVLVACPENSLIDAKDFLRPIVTPYELEIALQAKQSWTGKYVLDFGKLLDGKKVETNKQESGDVDESDMEQEDPDQPAFSLVTGKYRHAKRYGVKSETPITEMQKDGSAVVLRNQDNQLVKTDDSAAAQFLQSRTYRGLDPRIGEDAPGVLEVGRSGVARGYQTDRTTASGS